LSYEPLTSNDRVNPTALFAGRVERCVRWWKLTDFRYLGEVKMFYIADIIEYYFKPKYVVMKGIGIDNRAIMFLGNVKQYGSDSYGNKTIKFKNQKYEYYYSNIHERIWSSKRLKHWRRLIGDDTKCLQKIKGEWVGIDAIST